MTKPILAFLPIALFLPTAAHAQSAAFHPDPSIEFVLATRGISKGLSQTDGAQVLVRGEVGFGDFYVGAYGKNVTSTTADGEAGATIGLRKAVGGLDVAASATWKRAIDPAPDSDANALELATSASRKFGDLTPKVSLVWSPDDVGSTGRTLFAEAGASYRFAKAFAFSAAVGRRERNGGLDYTAYNAGIAWTPAKPFTVDLRYYDTNRDPGDAGDAYKGRFVLTGRAKF
jgi:uncharacterized protein (TIGR02001 family)